MSDEPPTDWHAVAEPVPSGRSFGVVFGLVFNGIALLPWLQGRPVHLWAIAVALVFLLPALLRPAWLVPAAKLWLRFGLLLHRIVSPVVLGAMFFLGFTLTGAPRRLLGTDPMRRRFDAAAASYWIPREPPGPDGATMKRQF